MTLYEKLQIDTQVFLADHPRGLHARDLMKGLVRDTEDPKVTVAAHLKTHFGAEIEHDYLMPVDATFVQRFGHELELRYIMGLPDHVLAALRYDLHVGGSLHSNLEMMPLQEVLRKIENSAWRWGSHSFSWDSILDYHEMLAAFTMDHPDFSVYIDHTRGCNHKGRANYTYGAKGARTFIDGPIGLMVYYKERHVLTIGLAPSGYGLLVLQVQLVNHKGNRFLYQLAPHYLDYVLERLQAVCRPFGIPLRLTTGENAADSVQRSHGDEKIPDWENVEPRIIALYNRPLANFKRMKAERISNGIDFCLLVHKDDSILMDEKFKPAYSDAEFEYGEWAGQPIARPRTG